MDELLKLTKPRLENKNAHPYHMYNMIMDTPSALERIFNEEQEIIEKVVSVLDSDRIDRILLIGIGTSWHAALNAHYLLTRLGNLDQSKKSVVVWNSFDFIQQSPHLDSKTAVFIFSHRGIKTYSYQSYMKAKEAGSYVVLLTGTEAAVLEPLDAIIRTSKNDQSAAFTISHSSSYYVCLILSAKLGAKSGSSEAKDIVDNHLSKVPQYFSSLLKDETPYKRWAETVQDKFYLPFSGYLGNTSNAYEVALKIKESSYCISEGFNVEQLIHGPFVAFSSHTALTAMITDYDKLGKERSHQLLKASKHVGATVLAITTIGDNTTESIVGIENTIKLIDVPDSISILTNLGCLQLLSYHLAILKKVNPDTFRRDQPLHSDCFSVAGLTL
ncbi:hypothetical protein CYY_001691 [Polysphondylium violaceum]|uniref:SIS domain-containing protein n=1 Tax=Polysphondylium violaceum TaxID=133409 RepID=A0A8J4V7M6_9MYCE|nr:hypothetical protein CYY_001691 [Polysphondylium violaceum]